MTKNLRFRVALSRNVPGLRRVGVNDTHTSPLVVLLFCDTVKRRNVSKSNRFHYKCKPMSVNKPVCRNLGGWGFTPRAVPTIPPPSAPAEACAFQTEAAS